MAKTFNFNSHLLLLRTTFMKFINKNDPHLTLPYLKMIPSKMAGPPSQVINKPSPLVRK